jgi:DNA-binding CsgD family transcriptional regulator
MSSIVPSRLTRTQRDAFDAVRRACLAPLDSIRLREEIVTRTAAALPWDFAALGTCDPETGLMAHGVIWNYPGDLLDLYYRYVYPQEGAIGFLDLARSGRLVSTQAGPIEREMLAGSGVTEKLRVAIADQGRIWGAWCLGRETSRAGFSDDEESFARALAPMIAHGLRRAALLEAAEEANRADDDVVSTAPGVAVYDARNRLVMRDARAARYMCDLADARQRSEMPTPVASALTQLTWRLRATDGTTAGTTVGADDAMGVRMRGCSGRWYAVHASAAEHDDARCAAQSVVVLTPLGGGERASILARLYGLSPREREVVVRIARGDSGKQIAAALGLSAHTVQAHIDNACAKIGVLGRRELVARLFVDAAAARMAS